MPGYGKTIGTLLIGIAFNTFLYGLVMYQFALYYRKKFDDPPTIKYMVLLLFILDNVHSISVIYMLWEICVTNYDNPPALLIAYWPLTFTPIAAVLASFATQSFLGYRVFRLTQCRLLYVLILLISFPSLVLGIICGVKAWIIGRMDGFTPLGPVVTAWLSLQVGADVFVAIVLTTVLWKFRTGFHRTDSVVYRVMRGAIQTGFFAGIFSLGDLITFLRFPHTNLYGMFAIPIGRIYTNTLLDTLLAREEIRDQLHHQLHLTTDLERSVLTTRLDLGGIRMSSGQLSTGLTATTATMSTSLATPTITTITTAENVSTSGKRQTTRKNRKKRPSWARVGSGMGWSRK